MKQKIIIVGILSLILGSAVVFYRTNNLYGEPSEVVYQKHEWIRADYLKVRFDDCVIYDNAQLESELGITVPEDDIIDGNEMKIVLVRIDIKNFSKEKMKFIPVDFVANAYGWSNGISRDLFLTINNVTDMQIVIEPKKTIEIVLPYYIYSSQLSAWHWQEVCGEDVEVVITEYPVKTIVRMGSGKK